MDFITLFSLLFLILVSVLFLFPHNKYNGQLPPGSFGLPLIGQSPSLLKAFKADSIDKWLQERIKKYGPIWKCSLFGHRTVVLHGQTANKFVYDGHLFSNKLPVSMSRILGSNTILELSGIDHKRVRGSLLTFLKPNVLKQCIEKVDEEIQHHLQTYWHDKHEFQVQPLMSTLTFNIICSVLFGIERGPKREKILSLFEDIAEGLMTIPINLPFTKFNRALFARKKLVPMLLQLIKEKREAFEKQRDPNTDLITLLLNIREDDGSTMSEDVIIDNIIAVMFAGYDTTSTLLTLLIRLLANNKSVYSTIVEEHKQIASSKGSEESLTWEDLTKMKYTWRVATETMRINPPAVMSFRVATEDIQYEGFIIPKGWQVLLLSSLTHMDDSIFQNPTMFDPTRFEKQTPPPFSYVAFGAGPRMCPGIELAKTETLAMIHRLVTKFTWELVKKDESFKRIPMPKFDQGLLVRVKPLKDVGL